MMIDENVIAHKKDDERENHKYIARVKVKNPKNGKSKWRYFYTLPEYKAYIKGQKYSEKKAAKKENTSLSKKLSDGINDVSKSLKKIGKTSTKKLDKLADKGAKALSKTVKQVDKVVDKAVDKSKKEVKKLSNKSSKSVQKMLTKVDKTIDKATAKGEKALDKFVDKGKQHLEKTLKRNDKSKEDKKSASSKGIKADTKVGSIGDIGDHVKTFVANVILGFFGGSLGMLAEKLNQKDNDEKDDGKDKIPENYKHRVKLPNGKYAYFENDDEYEDYMERLEYQKNEPEFLKHLRDISDNDVFTKLEDMDKVNELYSPYDDSRSENCANCSMAYELRRRGYDVEAKKVDGDYNGNVDRIYDYFEDAELIGIRGDGSTISCNEKFIKKAVDGKLTVADTIKNSENNDFWGSEYSYSAASIEKAILDNNPPGSRGFIDVSWKSGGSHSIVYEVDTKGKVTIRDAQTYDEYGIDELAHSVNHVRIARTDNLQVKEEALNAVTNNVDNDREFYADEGYIRYYK